MDNKINNKSVDFINKFVAVFILSLTLALASCGGGGDSAPQQNPPVDTPPDTTPTTQAISGGGVKGPLVNAVVTVFAFDAAQGGFNSAVVATATTDASAKITGLNLPLPLNPPYLMEFTSVSGTTDITTGMSPVISILRTVITQALLDGGRDIYATPLTTLAVDIAVMNVTDTNGTVGIQADEFEAALALAALKVTSTLGFGLDSSVDIFDTPPLINSTTISVAEQAKVAGYRAAIEAITAIVYQISQQSANATADTVLADLAADLADNGIIEEGSSGGSLNANTLQILQQDPSLLPIPNTSPVKTVADVQSILDAEKAVTGSTTATTNFLDGTIVTLTTPVRTESDSDGDGIPNVDDAFPDNSNESVDSDGDGIGDNTDPDDDNDGILDEDENFVPLTPTVNDNDGDGVVNGTDNCIDNINPAQTDTDGDLIGNACDLDDDGDGVNDVDDAFPEDGTKDTDTDHDGEDDRTDLDDDNDGIADDEDTGLGQDGVTPCSLLVDCDDDGVLDGVDANPTDPGVGINFVPIANTDTVTVDEDAMAFLIDVTANDIDEIVNLTAVAPNDASLGTVSISENNIQYIPIANANGIDTFSYTVSDGVLESQGTVVVTIVSINDAPSANDDSFTTDEDIAIVTGDVTVNDIDVDGDTLSATLLTNAVNGNVVDNGNGTFTYTPAPNFAGSDSFSYTVSDGNGSVVLASAVSTTTGNVTIIVNPVNDSPVANADNAAISEGQSVNINLALNDTDIEGPVDLTSIMIVLAPSNGSVVVNANGTVNYTHDGSETVTDSFSYTIRDASGLVSNVASVDLIVTPQNDAPVANADIGNVNEGQGINLNLSANDIDAENALDLTSILIITGPTNGSLAVNANGSVDYTHDGSETVTDSFSYTIRDALGAVSNAAAVGITVNAINDAPVASADSGSVNEGQNVNINLASNDSDIDNAIDLTSITISTAPVNGTLVVNTNGSVDYTHDGSETQSDNFTYTIRDASGLVSNVASVALIVTPQNDAPVANADSGSVNEGQIVNLNLAANDTDVDNAIDLTSIIITAGPINGSVVVNANGTVDYTHNGLESTADSFSYTIRDVLGAVSNVTSVNLIITLQNDAPIANNDNTNVDEGQSVNINLASNDTDIEGPVDLTSIVIALAPTKGVLVVNANGTVDYTHDGSETLNDSFSYTIRDSVGAVSNTATVSIIVNAINDAPVANADSSGVNEGQSVVINLVANDTDVDNAIDPTSITITAEPANGSVLVNADGTIGYTHNGLETTADSFSYTVRDALGVVSNIASVSINIVPQNDAPVANADSSGVNEGQSVNINLAANDTDSDNALDLNSIFIALSPSNGTLVVNVNGTVDYTHDGSETLSDNFVYTISDVSGAVSNTVVVSLTVIAVNDAPVANADNSAVNEGQSVNINLAANDSDVDNALDLTSIAITTGPANGSLVVNASGSVDYTHDGSETLSDSFSYTLRDVSGELSNIAEVNIVITPINNPPLANADSGSVNEGQSVNINLAANDTDVDNAIDLTSITIVTGPANGSLVVNANGTVGYTHDGSETLNDNFTYIILDVSGTVSNTAAVSISVNAVNDIPVANTDSGNVNEGQSVNINLAINDTDVEGSVDLTSIVISISPTNGTLVVNANGTVDYTHNGSETLSDNFSYTIRDASGAVSNTAVVNIIVTAVNDAPVANADNSSVNEGQSVNINLAANDSDVDNVLDLGSITIITAPLNGSLVVNANGTVDYAHDGTGTVVDSFSYNIKDISGAVSNTTVVNLTITPQNDAPVANADSGSVNEGQSVVINLAANDTDVDNAIDLTSITIASVPANGEVTINANGTIAYTHDGSETIADSFTYTIRDVLGAVSNAALVNVTVTPQNDAPVANADSGSVNEGQSVNLNLAANDSDADNALDLTSITISTGPVNGSVVVNANGTVDYVHDGSETLSDSFAYTIRDASGSVSQVATVSLTVISVNDAPVANADSGSVNEGQSININLAANDSDADNALDLTSITIALSPSNGSVVANANGTVDYTHDGSENAVDSFTYTIRDASGAVSQVATVSLTILLVNDLPVANADSDNVNEGQSINVNLASNDTDVEGPVDLTSIIIVLAPTNGSLVVNADGTVDYTHDGSETLSDNFSYTIRDANGATSNIAVVSLNINPQNDVPVASADSATADEGQSVNINLAVNDVDPDNALDLTSITIITTASNGSVVVNANGTVDYTHDGSETLSDNFTYTISDASGAVSQAVTVSLTIVPVNDAPVANTDSGSVNEGQSTNLNLAANDNDVDDALDLTSITIVLVPSNGSLVINANGSVDYTHDGSETLSDSFTYTIRDASGAVSQVATVSLTILSVNDLPVANEDSGSVNEGQSVNLNLALNDTDVEGVVDLTSIVISISPTNGALVVNANGTVDYTHDGSETLSDSFSYTIRDANGATSNIAVVSLTITPQNDAPVASTDSGSVNESQSVNINVAANDTDVDNAIDLTSITIVATTTNGSLVVNANGTVDYTHNGSETLSDSFTYTIRDASGAVSNTAVVNIIVTAVNDAPVANADNSAVNEGQSVNINLAANDTDVDNAIDLTSVTIIVAPSNGALVVNANGTVDYTHNGSETLSDNFTYSIRDASGLVSNVASVGLIVTPQNDAPVASTDSGSVNEGQSVNINVASNDTDVDNAIDLTSITIVATTTNGSLVVNANGTVDYTHNGSETLNDNFTYTIRDASGAVSNIATVNIIVTAVNDAPVATADSGSVNEGQSVNINLAANDNDVDNAIDLTSITIIVAPSNGLVVVNANGTVDYTHNGSETLSDNFTYTIRDASGLVSNVASVGLIVTPQNDAPVANADIGNANEGQSVNINLAANDNDADNAIDLTSITITTTASNGSVVVNANGTVDYTHNGSETLSDTFMYTIRDVSGAVSNIASVAISVNAINDAPVANADNGTVSEGQSININLIANDSDADNAIDLTSITITTGPANGALTINANGTVDYAHNGSETLSDNFTYTIRDASGALSQAAGVAITIVAVNDAPVANGDNGTVNEGQSININLAANDTDIDNALDLTSLSIAVLPSHGSLVINTNGTVDYTHNGSETLSDTFVYTISDVGGVVSNTVVVSITVIAVNDAPVAIGDSGTVNEGQSVNINLAANDTDADNAIDLTSITIIAAPGNGSLAVNTNGTIDYTHNGSETLNDGFSYTIRDVSGALSQTATVSLTIVPVNDAPVANGDNGSVSEGQSINLNLAANDTDVDDGLDLTSIAITAGPANGSLTINANGTVDYTHDGSETLSDNFTYTIRDASGALSQATGVVITIVAVNDAPVANTDSGTVNEGQSININLAVNDTDVDNAIDLTSITITTTASNGSVVVNANGTVDYTHNGSETLSDTFMYTIRDVSGAVSNTASVGISVNAINDAPVANADNDTVDEGQSINLNLVANDVDAENALDLSSITIITAASNGSLVVNVNGTVDYTHDGSETLDDSFTYTIKDSSAVVSQIATVTLSITPVNDLPVGNADSFTVDATTATVLDVLANDTDVESTLTISNVSQGSLGSTVTHDGLTVTFTDINNATDVETFTYDVTDGTDIVTGISVTVNIIANIPPVANPDSASTDEDTAVLVTNVLANDNDGGDGPGGLSVSNADALSINGGSVVNNTDGTFTYTPALNFNGLDTFTYTVSDTVSTSVGTVTITVNPINDAPIAVDDNDSAIEDTQLTTINVLSNDTDAENDSLSVSASDTSSAAGGSVVNLGNGTFTYLPPVNFNGSDNFSYTVTDGLMTNIGQVSITVAAVNDAPVAVDDTATTVVDTTVVISNVHANDTDVDVGDVLSTVQPSPSVFTTNNGSVSYNGNGTFSYTPDSGFLGTDSFTYTVTDSTATAIGTVTITVTPPGIPIDILTLMSATEGGVADIEDAGTNVFAYATDNYNSVTSVFLPEDIVYNHLSGVFETIVNPGDLFLNGSQWLAEGDVVGLSDGNGGLDLAVHEANNFGVEVGRFKLTARFVDIQGDLLTDHLSTVWDDAMLLKLKIFSAGAKLITDYRFETLTESHILGVDVSCQKNGTTKFTDLNGNCNAINVDPVINATGYAQSLNEVIVATAWVDPNNDFSTPPGAIVLAVNDITNQTLLVQLVNGGAANYYIVDSDVTNAYLFVTNAVAGINWVQNTDTGVDMIQFQIPAEFTAPFLEDLSDGLNQFLTVQNGFVRQGLKHAVGDVEFSDGQLNGKALNEVLANFRAPVIQGLVELTGTWVSATASTNGDPELIHIFANGNYESSGSCDLDGSTGMEYGTVLSDGSTSSIFFSAQIATQGLCGPAQGNKVLSVNGDVLTLSEPGSTSTVYNRLLGTVNPIVGSWLLGNIQDTGEAHTILTLLDDTTFTLSQDCTTDAVSGFEYGTYVWDQGGTNNFTGALSVMDSNGSCGLHNNTALNISGFTITVVGDTLTLTDTVGGGSSIFTRVSPAYVIPVLQIVYTLDNLVMQPGDGEITGSFIWSYTEGNFASGTAEFTDISIPGYGTDITGLKFNFDAQVGIEITLLVNTNNNGVTIILDFVTPLSPTVPTDIDLATSAYEIEIGGLAGAFVSGAITPQ